MNKFIKVVDHLCGVLALGLTGWLLIKLFLVIGETTCRVDPVTVGEAIQVIISYLLVITAKDYIVSLLNKD